MANGPTRICVFNVKPGQQAAPPVVPIQTGSNLIDVVTGVDGAVVPSLGPASYGVPIVLNPNGLVDPSLLNTAVTAVAGSNLLLGSPLIHLYNVGGILTAEYASAFVGTSPPVAALSAQGFLTTPIDAGQPGIVAFSGLFTYLDYNNEFSLASVGAEVYLSAVTPGGITLTRPPSPDLDQTVGYVVAFTAPNIVTAIFLAGYSDFSRISGCLSVSQICSVQGSGALVQLTTGAPPPSPVTIELGSSANYAVLAYAGITNTGSTSITGGVIGSSPTPSITGFNPPPATVDNADAGAARTAAIGAYTYYKALPAGTTVSSVASRTFTPGTYTASSTLLFSGGTVTLNGAGLYIFQIGSALNVTTGPTIFVLTNGALAANVIWLVGSAASFDANQATGSFVGTIIAQAGISFSGGTLIGRAISTGASVTFAAAEYITVPAGGGSITAGDIVTFDAFGNTLDSGTSLAGLISSLFVNPMTTSGDMIYEGAVGSPAVLGPVRLPIGTTGQMLMVSGGIPTWETMVIPLTFTPVTNEFLTGYSAITGLFTAAQPSAASLSNGTIGTGAIVLASAISTMSFNQITSGTNTAAAMVVGTGASLSFTGTGTINADQIYGIPVSSTAPTAGQVLTAVKVGSPATLEAAWESPTGTSSIQHVRYNIGSQVQGNPVTGPWALTFSTPFADGNYTVEVTVTCGEAPGTPTITQFPSVGISCINYQATPGNGVNVWVANNDSITHTNITIHLIAIHD